MALLLKEKPRELSFEERLRRQPPSLDRLGDRNTVNPMGDEPVPQPGALPVSRSSALALPGDDPADEAAKPQAPLVGVLANYASPPAKVEPVAFQFEAPAPVEFDMSDPPAGPMKQSALPPGSRYLSPDEVATYRAQAPAVAASQERAKERNAERMGRKEAMRRGDWSAGGMPTPDAFLRGGVLDPVGYNAGMRDYLDFQRAERQLGNEKALMDAEEQSPATKGNALARLLQTMTPDERTGPMGAAAKRRLAEIAGIEVPELPEIDTSGLDGNGAEPKAPALADISQEIGNLFGRNRNLQAGGFKADQGAGEMAELIHSLATNGSLRPEDLADLGRIVELRKQLSPEWRAAWEGEMPGFGSRTWGNTIGAVTGEPSKAFVVKGLLEGKSLEQVKREWAATAKPFVWPGTNVLPY